MKKKRHKKKIALDIANLYNTALSKRLYDIIR